MNNGRRRNTHDTGLRAEALARLWLRCKGWRILATRVRTPVGEIDIIARRGRMLAFIEVKHRPAIADALHALRQRQRQRIVKAAAMWLARHPAHAVGEIRFDAIVLAVGWRIRHLPGVFRADEVSGGDALFL